MNKIISTMLVFIMITIVLSACSKDETGDNQTPNNQPTSNNATVSPTPQKTEEIINGRFTETRKITVEVFDRGNEGGSKPEDNFYTNFIKEGMLRDHNIEVTFVPVTRQTEAEQMTKLLAAGEAPDICVAYDYPTVQTYANMGVILDMSNYLEEYQEILPNLYGLLTEANINWDKDPASGTIWAIEARMAHPVRINTFVREDWLKKLSLSEPTTLGEFEEMLKAFQDNADVLLGADADKIIPFSISYDIGWRADHLLASFVPDNLSNKDAYIYGFDDRRLLYPGVKEGVAVLNKWYNQGLLWKDFALFGPDDPTEDKMMKAGYVGAFIHSWDYPYRNGDDSINNSLKKRVGKNAGYIAVKPFKNDAGSYRKFLPGPVDRKIFFPSTNDEPLASLLYLDWISRLENRSFLQIGEEGVTHEVSKNGVVKTKKAKGDKIMNSPNNIDYTITINGLDIGNPELNIESIAQGYTGVDPSYIERAYYYSMQDGRYAENINVGTIQAEVGMGPTLNKKRDSLLIQAVVADQSKFSSVFDAGLKDYLNSGGQAIIEERKAAYERTFE